MNGSQFIGLGGLRKLGGAVQGLIDYALPPCCPGCGVIVAADRQFCLPCWKGIHFLDGPSCVACSFPLPDYILDAEQYCGACLARRPYFSGAPAAIAYGSVARTIVLRLKYGRRLGLARLMSDMMIRPLRRLQGALPILLLPVPLHPGRLWVRGFNQSALVARHLAHQNGVDMSYDLLLRIRATPSMRGLNSRQRHAVVRGAFALRGDVQQDIAGRHGILVDDVYTSGATLQACARLLHKAGAARVSAVTFARVIPDAAPDQIHGVREGGGSAGRRYG